MSALSTSTVASQSGPSPLAADATVTYHQGDASLTVRRAYCKGCNLCVVACPTKILALDEWERVYVTDMHACLLCGVCAARCPDFVFIVDPGSGARAKDAASQSGEEGSAWHAAS